jgi:hypothetical protein
LVVAASGAAFGFTDDSSAGGATFVTAANALKAAGCAAGFGDGSFGYNSNVTRGQDAIFDAACQAGEAYVNNSTTTTRTPVNTTPVAISSVTFTAGINPGGLQFIEVRGAATVFQATINPQTVTPTITVTPSAGGTAPQPSSQTCDGVGATSSDFPVYFACEGGFIVPTGQSFTVTFSAVADGPVLVVPGTLAVNSAPRGNTISSGKLS